MPFPIRRLDEALQALEAAAAYLTGQPCPNERLTDAAEMARGAALVVQDVLETKQRNQSTPVAPLQLSAV